MLHLIIIYQQSQHHTKWLHNRVGQQGTQCLVGENRMRAFVQNLRLPNKLCLETPTVCSLSWYCATQYCVCCGQASLCPEIFSSVDVLRVHTQWPIAYGSWTNHASSIKFCCLQVCAVQSTNAFSLIKHPWMKRSLVLLMCCVCIHNGQVTLSLYLWERAYLWMPSTPESSKYVFKMLWLFLRAVRDRITPWDVFPTVLEVPLISYATLFIVSRLVGSCVELQHYSTTEVLLEFTLIRGIVLLANLATRKEVLLLWCGCEHFVFPLATIACFNYRGSTWHHICVWVLVNWGKL